MQHPKEWPISQEERQKNYRKIDYSVFCDSHARLAAQSDISLAFQKKIEYLTPQEIFDNTRKTLEFKKHIESSVRRIIETIEVIKSIRNITPWIYWLHLELRIPKLEKRLKKLNDRIKENYKKSNTHIQLSNREQESIKQEWVDIKNGILKFQENLKEYF